MDLNNLVPGSINGAFFSNVKNDVRGIGLSIFSDNSSFGSAGKLQGAIFHNYDDPSSFRGTLLHELMHRWGNFVVPITSFPGGPHWGFSSSGGYLDCYDISNMIDHGAGRFSAPNPFYFRSSEQYSPIELYLAGFIPPEEVPDFQTAEDGEWLLDERGYPVYDDNGYRMFTASGFKTHTIEDIIAEHGPRVPDHPQAQKDFRAAVILLTSEDYPATRERLERLSDDVFWFSRAGKDESGPRSLISTKQPAAGVRSPWRVCRSFKAALSRKGWHQVPSERNHRPSWILENDRDDLGRTSRRGLSH